MRLDDSLYRVESGENEKNAREMSSFLSGWLTGRSQESEMCVVTEKQTLAAGDANAGWLRLTLAHSQRLLD